MIITTGNNISLICKADYYDDNGYFTQKIKRNCPSLLRFIKRKKILVKGDRYSLEEDCTMMMLFDGSEKVDSYFLPYGRWLIKFEGEKLSKYFYTNKELRKSKLETLEKRNDIRNIKI